MECKNACAAFALLFTGTHKTATNVLDQRIGAD